jgi:SCP-2 sterol transfer family protein
MARFLSPAWFAEVASLGSPRATPAPAGATADLVLEQVVRDTPDGEVRYRVVVTDGSAYIEGPRLTVTANGTPAPPDLTITCDWATATAMAQGELSTHSALLAGRLRVRGDMARLAGRGASLVGLDPVPRQVRRQTTY